MSVVWPALKQAFRRSALPLGCYYAVTLALPLANGAAQSGAAFVNHALAVVVVPPIVIVLLCAIHKAVRTFAECLRSPSPGECDRNAPVNAILDGSHDRFRSLNPLFTSTYENNITTH